MDAEGGDAANSLVCASLERETEGRVDQVAADPVLDSELMKPPGAEVDLLGPRLERIAGQPTIAMSATKFSVTLVLLPEPVAGMRLPPA